jgi:hypothetical protein
MESHQAAERELELMPTTTSPPPSTAAAAAAAAAASGFGSVVDDYYGGDSVSDVKVHPKLGIKLGTHFAPALFGEQLVGD